WFGHVIVTTGGLRGLLLTVERVRGDRDDRDRSQRRISLDPARGGVTVYYRELDVHQDKVWPLLCDRRERLFAVFGFDNLIICRGQHIADNSATIRLVLDNQNPLAHVGSACRSTTTGSENANVEPCPGCDSTQILPPCISMMRLDIAKPKPVPPFLRVM